MLVTVLVCTETPIEAPTMPNPSAAEPTDESIPALSEAVTETSWSACTLAWSLISAWTVLVIAFVAPAPPPESPAPTGEMLPAIEAATAREEIRDVGSVVAWRVTWPPGARAWTSELSM